MIHIIEYSVIVILFISLIITLFFLINKDDGKRNVQTRKREEKMKFKIMLILLIIVIPLITSAQTLEAEKTHPLSKDAKKGELFHFSFNEDTNEYLLIYSREKKKDNVYEIYKFDYDFNLLKNETIEGTKGAKEKYTDAFPVYESEGKWNNPSVLRVENNWGGNIVLRKGDLTRKWATSTEFKGDYKYTTRYLKYTFNEKEKISPKYEGELAAGIINEKLPKFFKKLAIKAAKKLTLVDYITDEPAVEITTGAQGYLYKTLWQRDRDYASANGDVVVIASNVQSDEKGKQYYVKYVVSKYSSADLSLLKNDEFTFEYSTHPLFKHHLSDGSVAIIFVPASVYKPLNPNLQQYHYVRISKDAEILDNITFESKGGHWLVTSISLSANDDVYIYGQASLKKKDKEPQKEIPKLNKLDNLQIMKISNHKIDYFTSVTVDEMNEKRVTPGNQKKVKKHDNERYWFAPEPVVTSSDHVFLTANSATETVHYYHFDDKGVFQSLYDVKIDETKNAIAHGLVQLIFENPDKSMTCMIAEIEGEKKGRQLRYPKTTTLDINSHTLSDLQTFGIDKKFYLDDGYPITFIDNNGKLTFFSRDKSNKNIWFGRVKLGK